MTRKAVRYLVAKPACYRILLVTRDNLWVKVIAGSDRVLNRVVGLPIQQWRVSVRARECAITRTKPPWIGQANQSALIEAAGKTATGTKKRVVKKGRVR